MFQRKHRRAKSHCPHEQRGWNFWLVLTVSRCLHSHRYRRRHYIKTRTTMGLLSPPSNASKDCFSYPCSNNPMRLLHGPRMHGKSILPSSIIPPFNLLHSQQPGRRLSCHIRLRPRRLLSRLAHHQARKSPHPYPRQRSLVQYHNRVPHGQSYLRWPHRHRCPLLHRRRSSLCSILHPHLHPSLFSWQPIPPGTMAFG